MATKLGALSVFLTADTSPFARKMRGANGSVTKLSAGVAAFGVASAAAFLTATMKLKDFTAESLAASKRFAEVNTLLQLEPKGLEALKGELFDINSELGFLTEDSIPALYQAISAGIPKENVIDFLKVAGKSAKAGVTTMETSVDGLTSIIDAYSLSVEDAEMVSDKFLKTVVIGKTKFEFLAEGIGKIAPLASALNINLDELFGVMVSLTKVGLNTDEAFTGFRGVLTALLKPSDDLIRQLDQLQKAGKAADVRTNGLLNVMKSLQVAVDNDAQALAKLFPKVRGLNAAFAILKNEAADTSKFIDQVATSADTTNQMFKKIAEDPSMSMEQAASNWEQMKINIGDIVKGSGLIGFLTKSSGLVKNMSKDLKAVAETHFKITPKEDKAVNDIIAGKKSAALYGAEEMAKIALTPLTLPITKPFEFLEAGAARRVDEAESNRVAKIQDERKRRRSQRLSTSRERMLKDRLQKELKAEKENARMAAMFKDQYAGEGGRIAGQIESEKRADKLNKTISEKIKNLRLELKLSKMIAEGREKDAFILKKTAAFGKDLTDEQRATIAKLAGSLFDTNNVKPDEAQMKGPALSEAIRAGSQAEAALLARAMVPETDKKLRKRNVDANIAAANELKTMNVIGLKVRGMKQVETFQ